MAVLTVEKLGHRFDRGWLFRGVEIELGVGDRLVVMGRNGSGKSTLLKALAGLIVPLEGKILCEGRLGYAGLDLAVYGPLTAREHLELCGAMRGVEVDVVGGLEKVGLKGVEDQGAGTFSTGMKARLKTAMALVGCPQVLVMDEPTAAMDEAGRELVESVVSGFDGAVVVATNEPGERRWATHELELG